MKQIITSAVFLAFLGMPVAHAQKLEHREVIKKEISLDPGGENTLAVKNIFGSISIEAYSGATIQMEVVKIIRAQRDEDLETGKQELKVKVNQNGKQIVIHPDAPYIKFDEKGLGFKWCDDYGEVPYDHPLDFPLKVPANVTLHVSTINDGDITISDTRGSYLNVENINGGITLNNVSGQTRVSAINGAVSITYASNPTKSSYYHSLNGDINISFQKELSADIAFSSMNGDLYTDFDIARQFAKTNRNNTDKGDGLKYSYEAKPVVQIGKGGIDYDIETLNGNVIIKKI